MSLLGIAKTFEATNIQVSSISRPNPCALTASFLDVLPLDEKSYLAVAERDFKYWASFPSRLQARFEPQMPLFVNFSAREAAEAMRP
jgi:hypothetical protein